MKPAPFPSLVTSLPPYEGPFDAYRLAAPTCDILFASYPAGTVIDEHVHETENVGVITAGELRLRVRGVTTCYGPGEWYHVRAREPHAASFAVDTAEIEFWFAADRDEPGHQPGTGFVGEALDRPPRST